MTYIILDLEWDSVYSVKHKKFINQILQIGAVKLDEKLNIIDTFEATIRSDISKKVSSRFSKITGITTENMLSGMPLSDAVIQYNSWVGNDTVTMSWSNSDLYSILENEKCLLDGLRFNIEKYLDLQVFIQNEMRFSGAEVTSQISLADAADFYKISTENLSLHTAKDDCLLCVALLQKNYCKERFDALIKDTRDSEFYNRLCFKPYFINNITDPLIDKTELNLKCEFCDSVMKRKTKWRYRNRWFFANFVCENCKKSFSGRVSFRKNFDNIIVKHKVIEKNVGEKHEMQSMSAKV